jgi:thermitase
MNSSLHETLRDPEHEGFALETVESRTPAEMEPLVASVLKDGWRVEAFGDRGTDFQVVPDGGTGLSVTEAWERTYDLRRRPGVLFAEPLFMVTAPDEEAGESSEESFGGGGEQHLPGSDKTDWSINLVRVPEAWALFKPSGRTPGEGVVVGHPDTGYRRHPEIVDNLLINQSRDFIDDDNDAEDDLRNPGHVVIHNPSHGTGTASVIVSPSRAVGGPDDRDVIGVAPGARLIPLRVARSVVLVSMLNLARAIEYAAAQGAHVISISMGGLWSSRLRKAILYAQRRGVIVLAAAGNKVKYVVWPAAYDEVVAVAACNAERRPWSGSSRGDAVDVTAPGESVWRAKTGLLSGGGGTADIVTRGSGTSYAVATTAGVAALWLSYHGRDKLVTRYGAEKIPFIFNEILRSSAVTQPGLRGGFGQGLVDAFAVLSAALPAGPDEEGPVNVAFAPAPSLEEHPAVDNGGTATFDHLFESASASLGFESVGASPSRHTRAAIAELLGVAPEQVAMHLRQVGQELAFHLATRPELYRQVYALLAAEETHAPADPAAARATLLQDGASSLLRRHLEQATTTSPTVDVSLESLLGADDEDACGLDVGEGAREGGRSVGDTTGGSGDTSLTAGGAPSATPGETTSGSASSSDSGPIQIRITRDEVQVSINPASLGRAPAPAGGSDGGATATEGLVAELEEPEEADLETTMIGLTTVPADKLGQGYGDVTIRADLKESYLKALKQVRALGGILTSSGGIRHLSVKATPGRSKTSLHYTGRALDLFIHTGMKGPNDRYAVVRDGGSDAHPLWKVYCISETPDTADPLYDASLVQQIELECAIWRAGKTYSTIKRSGRWICLTDVLARYGWNRIPARADWRSNYLSVEWWHFQHHKGLIVGQSKFGPELTAVWPAHKVQASGLALGAVWSGLSFRA